MQIFTLRIMIKQKIIVKERDDMKIGILSDIHVDVNYKEDNRVEDAVLKCVEKNNIEILIIAGDISSDYRKTLSVLNEFEKQSSARILFVPGNHDIWNKKHQNMNTNFIYNELKKYKGNLSRKNIVIGDWAFVGDIGWYDYSFGSDEYEIADFCKGKAFERTWQDKNYVDWEMTDIEVNDRFYNMLKERLEQVKDKKIIFVTHMVIHEAFIVHESREIWKYFNAFLGSKKYKNLIKEYNVKYAIMGHVHYRKRGKVGSIEYICNCLNYRNEWYDSEDAYKEVDKAMYLIEI